MVHQSCLIYERAGAMSASTHLLGGKGYHLAELERAGQPVPDWFCVTTDAFRSALQTWKLDEKIEAVLAPLEKADEAAILAASRRVQGWIRRRTVPREIREPLLHALGTWEADSPFVAVRSSAVDEDAAGGSFAGLHDSFLFVQGADQVVDRLKAVWVSAYNQRALAYRVSQGIPLSGITVAVIVQRMVHATVSGVMFTANPNSGNVHEVVVSSLYGAGEGIVSAGLDADTFIVNKSDLSSSAQLVPKTRQLVLDQAGGSGLKEVAVPRAAREEASLDAGRLREVAQAGLAIEAAFRRPQDIEFSLDTNGRLYILQARPITTVQELGPAAGHHLVWDNSNIIESYSGVTSPMTYSFIRHAYTIVYHCFSDVMGISPKVVKANRYTFENMLGLFRGEVYYNLFNWYRLVRLFPGFNYNKAFMESMMGVTEPVELAREATTPTWGQRYGVELPALVRLLVRSTWHFARIRRRVGDFQHHFDEHYARWSAMDLDRASPQELMATYREMEDKLLWQWKAPIINDFFVMIFYGVLRKLCAAWCGDESGSLQNDLLCGEGEIESTLPTRMLLNLAKVAREDPALTRIIRRTAPARAAAEIPADPRFSEFAAGVEDYLDRYGFRCMNELKLEEPSMRDRPDFLYQILRNYLAMDPAALDVAAMEDREQKIRRQAETKVDGILRNTRGGFVKRILFDRVLRCARLGVKNRENMRFARTKIYGLVRDLLRALGRQFAAEGLLAQGDDVFYLTIDEVWDYVKGTAVTTALKDLVRVRKKEFAGYRKHPEGSPDDHFDTYGLAYHRNAFRNHQPDADVTEEGVLKGTGCCPGEVTREVKVLLSPADDMKLSGEILVAGRTDPGWVPLYPSVSGILIERGSILSHSAIVAREMGIPTIVGIPRLTTLLETGQVVTMNGSDGTVRTGAQTGPDPRAEEASPAEAPG